jgi:signal transduction histidine kinase
MAVGMQGVLPSTAGGAGTLPRPQDPPRARPGEDSFVFPLAVRRGGWVLLAVTVVAVAWAARSVEGERDHITAWVVTSAVFALPGLWLTWAAGSRVAPSDRPVWRLWYLGFCSSVVGTTALLALRGHNWDWARAVWMIGVGISILGYGAGNTVIMRSRAGRRATAPDVLDLTTLVVAVTAPVALLVGDAVVSADDAWFAISWSVITIALVHGVACAAVLAARIRREDRHLALLALALASAALVESAGQVALALDDFRTPSTALLAWHALACGLGSIFVIHAVRQPSIGLDRLPPQAQVRRRNVVSVVVLAVVPVVVVEAWWGRETSWILLAAGAGVALLLVLSSLRHLLVARETGRLYLLVEQAADERRQLLADVIHHVEGDRYRMAARLHQQAMSSYSAMATFVTALELSPPGRPGAALSMVAARTRTDLAQQVDSLRDVLAAMAPPQGDPEQRLVAPLRAYVDSLYADGCRPELEIDVDGTVVPDWTTEVLALRIIQAALDNVHQHSRCRHITITLSPRGRTVVVDVVDDGVGFGPAEPTGGTGLATMRTLAGFLDGCVEVLSEPGRGTWVRAVLGAPVPPGARPDLRLVAEEQ